MCICGCLFFNDTATTEIYTLSLHDALPIFPARRAAPRADRADVEARLWVSRGIREVTLSPKPSQRFAVQRHAALLRRSEEHTSELQSRQYLVCRLLLEKKTCSYTMLVSDRH